MGHRSVGWHRRNAIPRRSRRSTPSCTSIGSPSFAGIALFDELVEGSSCPARGFETRSHRSSSSKLGKDWLPCLTVVCDPQFPPPFGKCTREVR